MEIYRSRPVTFAAIPSAFVLASILLSTAAAATRPRNSRGGLYAPSARWWSIDGTLSVLQAGGSHQLAALVGIVALVFLGCALVVRNRLDEDTEPERSTRTTPDADVVTDRERVRTLIRDHDGRMKQSEIVCSVEWSKAKVSRLLADLESEGEITKLRLGRENLICLRGHEPPASRAPEQPEQE